MRVSRFVKGFVVAFVLFVLLDMFWHGGVMAEFYARRLMMIHPGAVNTPPTFAPFILFLQAINAVTLTYIVQHCSPSGKPLTDAAWIGALLGFTVIGSVNVLNHTLIPRWDIQMVLVDTTWGTIAGLVAGIAIVAVSPPPKHRGFFWWLKRG